MASLSFANSEVALKHLYIRSNPKAFGFPVLFWYSLFYYALMSITSGTWIAAGLLVPQLICGAAWGRLYGYFFSQIIGLDVDPGVYALLGSSAFMSGVSRLTIALVVIMIEITNDLDALLPIMTVCMISKWVGDMFNHSIYDEALHANGIPFLEPDPPRLASVMQTREAMIADTYHVPEIATVQQCYNVVKDLTHKNIPVVDTGDDGTRMYMKGSIPRSHLAILIQERAFERRGLVDVLNTPLRESAIAFTPEELKMTLDLKPYTNVATFIVKEDFPLYLTYRTFRNAGLRELFVVSDHNELRGYITRPQLIIHDDHHPGGHGHGHGGGHGPAHGAPHGAPHGHGQAHAPASHSPARAEPEGGGVLSSLRNSLSRSLSISRGASPLSKSGSLRQVLTRSSQERPATTVIPLSPVATETDSQLEIEELPVMRHPEEDSKLEDDDPENLR